jgi:hypothetical protein
LQTIETWRLFFADSPIAKHLVTLHPQFSLNHQELLFLRFITLAFGLLGIISTYKLGFLLYNKRIGFVAALLTLSSVGLFYFQNSAHPLLVFYGLTIFAIWLFMEWVYYRRDKHFLWANVALGMLTIGFGFLGVLLPILSLVFYYLGKGNYKGIRVYFTQYHWMLFALIAIFYIGLNMLASGSWHLSAQLLWNFLGTHSSFSSHSVTDPIALLLPFAAIGVISICWRYYDLVRNFFSTRSHQEWLTPWGVFSAIVALLLYPNRSSEIVLITLPFFTIITSEYILRMLLEHKGIIISILRYIQLIMNGLLVYLVFSEVNNAQWSSLVFGFGFLGIGVYQWLQTKEPLYQVILSGTFTTLGFLSFYELLF